MKANMDKENVQTIKKLLQMDLDAIYLGNLNTLEQDLTLPEKGKNGSVFHWDAHEERFLKSDGRICRPLYGMGNRDIQLTVTASLLGITAVKEFRGTVLQEKKETVITRIRPVSVKLRPGEKASLPPVVIGECADGRLIPVPVKWEAFQEADLSGTVKITGEAEGTRLKARAEICPPAPGRKGDYVPMDRVRLLPGSCYAIMQQRMTEFLLSADNDRMLYNFRIAAGLDTKGARPMTGWDDPSCKLRGHTTGHYLSGLALAWAATGNMVFLDKINEMVRELALCQEAQEKQAGCHNGFLSAYSEEQFDLLEQYAKYPDIWAPYYTLDKIMSGLYDCHVLAGNEQARRILFRLGDWVYHRLSRLPKEQLYRMWSLYIAGEFGGMLGTLVKLSRLSGKEAHKKAAGFFLNEKLFYPMEENCDTLEDMHANQHIPQIMGAMELYQLTGEERYWKIGKHFWDMVTEGHIYCIGGTGETELFHRADTTCAYLTENAAESCASYNMLRLTGQLFPYLVHGTLMDYYENTLCNHIMASCSHASDGGTTYFMPQNPGGRKEYSTAENTCCHGTGFESRFRYMEHIFFQDPDYLYINLLIPCRLTSRQTEAAGPRTLLEIWQEREGVFCIRCHTDMEKKLALRIPGWAEDRFELQNSGPEPVNPKKEKGYLFLKRPLKVGEGLELRFPMELSLRTDRADARFSYLTWGPYIMAARSGSRSFLPPPRPEALRRLGETLHFTDGKLEYLPFWQINEEPYHIYFRKDAAVS